MNKPKKEDKLEEAKEKKSFWSYIVGFFKVLRIIGAVILVQLRRGRFQLPD